MKQYKSDLHVKVGNMLGGVVDKKTKLIYIKKKKKKDIFVLQRMYR